MTSSVREQQHLTQDEYVACPCDLCKGSLQLPRTSRAHMKRQSARRAAVGLDSDEEHAPRPGPSHSGDAGGAPEHARERHGSERPISLSPVPLTPPHDPPIPLSPSPPRSPFRSPVRTPPRSRNPSQPQSAASSPGVRQLLGMRRRASNASDGNLSDIAGRERDIGMNLEHNLQDFFRQLLGDDWDIEDDDDPFLGGRPAPGDDGGDDGNGGEEGVGSDEEMDENFGIAHAEGQQVEQPPLDFDLDMDIDPGHDPDGPDDAEPDFAAFDEPDLIRNAYAHVFIQKAHFHATHAALRNQLRFLKLSLSANPEIAPEEIARMAQTIQTVERRLGINTSDIITTYTLCPKCKRRYDPAYIVNADSSTCLDPRCNEDIFFDKTLASGERRRVSHLTYPVASLIAWLRRLFLHPGMAEMMQNWREGPDDDDPGTEPISREDWMEHIRDHLDGMLSDLPSGWQWREFEAGLERIVDLDGDPENGNLAHDQSTLPVPLRFVSLPYGLVLSMNIDWFQSSKEGNYSVGAVYFVINNLPRHLRFLRENICLATIMPGPKEPDDNAMNRMLEPIVQDLLDLEAGVEITVRTGDPPRYERSVVHRKLAYHIADLVARIKLGGGAGVASELNFCLHCHTLLSALSVAAGFRRQDFVYRDPQEDLQNVYRWKSLQDPEARQALFEQTGNRYTILHELPGWHTATQSPPDAMHLLYLGGVNWILKQVIVGPNLLAPRQQNARKPVEIYNDALDKMFLPYSVGRLPPKIGQTTARVKADQLKIMSKVMFVLLYLAMRDGDEISLVDVPRGTAKSTGGKHQLARAKRLLQHRVKQWIAGGRHGPRPVLENCFPSRSLPRHFKQILRFCVALNGLDSRSISPAQIGFNQSLLETLCIEYTRMNVPLSPNFHYMMHLEEFMLQTGSVYNTHVWPMERANGIVGRINTNGRGKGVLEGTMMRGWWEHASLRNLIRRYEAIPNQTAADNAIIDELLLALRGGPEHAQQQESTRLSTHSRAFKLDRQLHHLVAEFCDQVWPHEGIFGPGQPRQLYLPPEGAVRNFSYVEHDALRYGAFLHTFGRRACYGFINRRLPVRIERILYIEFPDRRELRTICALVRRFQAPEVEPEFPWSTWQEHLGVSHWDCNALSELVAIPVGDFSGIFAMLTVPLSYGDYWVTIALNNMEPEEGQGEDEGGDWA